MAAYVYASCGVWESTTDVVFGGHCLIAENGALLAESRRFQRDDVLLTADVDLDRLRADRVRTNSFGDAQLYVARSRELRARSPFSLPRRAELSPTDLRRPIDAHPFVPKEGEQLRERCEEIFQTQVAGLAKRLEHIGKPRDGHRHLRRPRFDAGPAGGLQDDGCPRRAARRASCAFTLPGFGTSNRTRDNARALMRHLGVTAREVDIRPLCLEEWKALGHQPFGIALDGLTRRGVHGSAAVACRPTAATTSSSRTSRPACAPAC